MKCDEAMEAYSLDIREGRPSLRVRLHIAHCDACAAEARRYDLAMDTLRSDCMPSSPDYTTAIMARIGQLDPVEGQPVSLRRWAAGGCLLVAAMLISPLGSDFAWVAERFGNGYLLPLNLVLSSIFTVYSAIFIATHMAELNYMVRQHRRNST